MVATIKEFNSNIKDIEMIQSYITSILKEYKVNSKTIVWSLLSVEELLIKFIENKTSKNDKIRVKIKKGIFNIRLKITCPGTEFNISEIYNNFENDDPEIRDSLNNLMKKILRPTIDCANIYGINSVTLPINRYSLPSFAYTIIALLFAIPAGFLFKNIVPQNISDFIMSNVFDLFTTAFLKLLKFLLAPLIFLSITSSIASISDLSKLGKVAIKIAIGYICTSIVAIIVCCFTSRFFLFKNDSLYNLIMNTTDNTYSSMKINGFRETILDIIPPDVISPFLNSNMLQLIFFAIIFGIALSIVCKTDNSLLKIIDNLNNIFMSIIMKITVLVPLYVFFSLASCIMKIDLNVLMHTFILIPAAISSYAVMIIAYTLILTFIGKVNPLKFFKKASPAMLTAFSLSSSNATIPETMKCCKKMGIFETIYSFSIPFGATINMDGLVCSSMTASLIFMHLLGIHLPLTSFITFCVSVILFSAGIPGIPNGGIMLYTAMFTIVGIPISTVSLIVAINSIIEMFGTTINVTGDMVMSTTVASTEKMLDLKKYNSK